jgi:hypothetical protein
MSPVMRVVRGGQREYVAQDLECCCERDSYRKPSETDHATKQCVVCDIMQPNSRKLKIQSLICVLIREAI